MASVSAFQRFAACCTYEQHGYLAIKNGTLVYDQRGIKPEGTSLPAITALAIRAFQERPSLETQEALNIFKAYLLEMKDDFLTNILNDSQEIDAAIDQIEAAIQEQKNPPGSEEAVFRLRFLSQLPLTLGVKEAPKTDRVTIDWLNGEKTEETVREWEIIEWLSKQVYQSKTVSQSEDRWQTYEEIMTGAYKGDALLLPDNAEHSGTQELIALGAIVRTSSHNEQGKEITGWKADGSPIYKGFLYEDIKGLGPLEHHWSLEGDHIKEILFYAADMRKRKNGKLICAKTVRQVEHHIQAGKIKTKDVDLKKVHHFTAFQFEFAPDCEGVQLLNWKYWYHKIYSSYLYRGMKRMGYDDANVGPYGFGRTDTKPRVIE